MYIPKSFEINDLKVLKPFLSENSFGILAINGESETPVLAHLPFEISSDEPLVLQGHSSIYNPVSFGVRSQKMATWIVSGPHAYISSSVYNHENVPTYNYIAIHLTGLLSIIEPQMMNSHLDRLTVHFEKNRQNPLEFASFSKDMIETYKKEIVCFEFQVSAIQAQFKLSQNRNDADFHSIIQDLTNGNSSDKLLAACMLKYRN
jgi:transcriptional regulator